MAFKDLVYTVEIKNGWRESRWDARHKSKDETKPTAINQKYEKREILKGVSGHASPGETVFIMGASGCGKTSLLNQISDRIMR